LFKYCPNQILRRCIPDNETLSVIKFCHTKAYNGHFSVKKTTAKILQCRFYWPTMFKNTHSFCKGCLECQKVMLKFLRVHIFSRFGMPKTIISDNAKHFCNRPFEVLVKKYRVVHRLSTSYHPQTCRQVELV
jgi:transposase InsO family protein